MQVTETERYALSIAEFSKKMGMCRTKIAHEIKSGRLKSVKCGTRRLIPASECIDWLDRLNSKI